MASDSSSGLQGRVQRKALVVDDQFTNRLLLKSMLEREDYAVVEAADGEEAIEAFKREHFDIVFMDVMMPGMDGYEATRRIKALPGAQMVPVFFLTALTDEQALAKCVEAGGDDFLSKPFNRTILKARIAAIERTSDLYQGLSSQHRELTRLHEEIEQQHDMAEKIFSRVVSERNPTVNALNTLLRPAAKFSGDVLLMGYRDDGSLDLLLGDFTGHGLSAAIGALPLSEVYRAMLQKGFAPSEVLSQINAKLYSLLPTGMFLAAGYFSVSPDLQSFYIWNGGMPDILLVDGESGAVKQRIGSTHLPLGIVETGDTGAFIRVGDCKEGDRIVMYSDGLLEARNTHQQMFGDERLVQAITSAEPTDAVFKSLVDSLDAFCEGTSQDDDVTIVDIGLTPALFNVDENQVMPRTATQTVLEGDETWHWFVELRGQNLRVADPVSLALDQLRSFEGIEEHLQPLYLIISELFNNALEHGVLKLDSSLKSSADGFTDYYEQREQRLLELENGYVWLGLEHRWLDNDRGQVVIGVRDSGDGFDYLNLMKSLREDQRLYGRGVALVGKLCHSLRYEGKGNKAQAVYEWERFAAHIPPAPN